MVLESPEEESKENSPQRQREVKQKVDVESFERRTYGLLKEAVEGEESLRSSCYCFRSV